MTDRHTHNRDRGLAPPAGPPAAAPVAEADAADLVGAYVLDALPDDERAAFERYLGGDGADAAALRREAVGLRPVVDLLPAVLEETGGRDGDMAAVDAGPSPALRGRILDAVRAEANVPAGGANNSGGGSAAGAAIVGTAATAAIDPTPTGDRTRTAETGTPSSPAAPTPIRPPGRIRPGRLDAGTAGPLGRIGWEGLAAAVLALALVGAVSWALVLQGRIEERDERIAALAQENVAANTRSNASAYVFTRPETAPADVAGATGELFYTGREQVATLSVDGLPPLEPGRVYVLWYIGGQVGEQPVAAGEFRLDAEGNGFLRLPNVPPGYFSQVAITAEPEAETYPTATGPVLLIGQVSAAG